MKDFNHRDKKNIKLLLSDLCCSICKKDFDEESLEVIDRTGDHMVCSLTCKNCGKNFGQVMLRYDRNLPNHSKLESVEGAEPISFDDVIEAHKFIRDKL